MDFVTLTKEEFEHFARNHPHRCYLQSCATAALREKNGWKSHFLGVKEDNQVIAATILFSKKRHLKEEFYALRGPLVDFHNEKVLTFFIENIKTYIKQNGGFLLRIDPYIEACSRDKDGNETNEFDNRDIKNTLKKFGFQEVEAKEMTDTVQAKYMYVIDLKEKLEDVMNEMDSKTRQMIRKNEKNGVVIRMGTKEDIPLFENIMEHTSERRSFDNRGEAFYQNMYDALSKENMISFVFAELDIDLALSNIQKEKEDIEKAKKEREEKRRLGKLNERKAKQKEKEEEQTLDRLKKKESEIKALFDKHHTERIPLGGILYILYEDEIASLFGGSYDAFKEFQPFYTIHYEMIKYAIEHGYKRYNFYAINNHLDKEDSQYGIYLFKRGFGGHVVEFLGEFLLPIDKLQYTLYQAKKHLRK